MTTETDDLWPALPYEAWKDTYATLHLWTQVVGKVALKLAPPLNHSWSIALQVTPRGISTRPLHHHQRSFTIQFDFDSTRTRCTVPTIRSTRTAAGVFSRRPRVC